MPKPLQIGLPLRSIVCSVAIGSGLVLGLVQCQRHSLLPGAEGRPESEVASGMKKEFWADPANSFKPYGSTVEGLLTFRGNPTRNFYGKGPLPERKPRVRWIYPGSGAMCSVSYVGSKADTWCGLGWTGQPAVFRRDGRLLLAFGGFDKKIHLLDAISGKDVFRPLSTGDIIKGSATVDPDGFPLIYIGSRDNFLRVVSFDQGKLSELWRLNAYSVSPVLWDDDWDASPLVLKDFLITGGENGHLHIVKLNRKYGSNGKVTVRPKLVHHVPGWDAELLKSFPKPAVSIENSVSVFGDTVYFANSAGLLQGWDLRPVSEGKKPVRVFRLWLGDDTDATISSDEHGFLYVASEYEIGNQRSRQVGQLLKIDPRRQGDDAIVWRKRVMARLPDGIWSSPALTSEVIIATTNSGDVFALDRDTGRQLWKVNYGNMPLWSSPAVIDNNLIVATCDGRLDSYRLRGKSTPQKLWSLKVSNGCFEATPAIWDGKIFLGNRDGKLYGIW